MGGAKLSEYNKVYICPKGKRFGVDFGFDCSNGDICLNCQEVKEEYNITNENERIPMTKARDFIRDVWGATWDKPDSITRNCFRFGILKKGEKHYRYTISYAEIYELMCFPLWKYIFYGGRLHGKKSRG